MKKFVKTLRGKIEIEKLVKTLKINKLLIFVEKLKLRENLVKSLKINKLSTYLT